MVIINKSNIARYSLLADRNIHSMGKSSDIDAAGVAAALDALVRGCGKTFCIRLNDAERALVERVLALDKEGQSVKTVGRPKPQPSGTLRAAQEEMRNKVAAIEAARSREEAVHSEATYASRADVDAARSKASAQQGEVTAKKLDKSAGEAVSLTDLMQDNKFIEDSMKHSHISTAMASEEGWDMDKVNAPKVGDAGEAEPAAASPSQADEGDQKPKAARRKRKASK